MALYAQQRRFHPRAARVAQCINENVHEPQFMDEFRWVALRGAVTARRGDGAEARELRARNQHTRRAASDARAHCIQSAKSQEPRYVAPGHAQGFARLRNRYQRRELGDDVSHPIGFERLRFSDVARMRTRLSGFCVAIERFGRCSERGSDGAREVGACHQLFLASRCVTPALTLSTTRSGRRAFVRHRSSRPRARPQHDPIACIADRLTAQAERLGAVNECTPGSVGRWPGPIVTSCPHPARSDERRGVTKALGDPQRHQAFGNCEGSAESWEVLAELAVRGVEGRPWHAQRGSNAARQVFRVWSVIGPGAEQPFSELVSDGVIDLASSEPPTQVDDRLATWPDERATSRKLMALSEADAAFAEQRDREIDGA
jgi:hypothetical protein